jgi:V8-like Glu-specific endopeptidase
MAEAIAATASIYDGLAERIPEAPRFASLLASCGSDEEALDHARAYAIKHGFFIEWQLIILKLLEQTGIFTPPEALDSIKVLDRVIDVFKNMFHGNMQALVSDRRLFNATVLVDLIRAGRACALVTANGCGAARQGTGVLVAPNLVITAAHVIQPLVANVSAEENNCLIQIQFRNRLEAPSGQWPLTAEADADWLESWSPPCGDYPKLGPGAADKLDFVLIRLRESINDIAPLSASDPPSPQKGQQIFVIGHPGNGDLLFHGDEILDIQQDTARVHHGASTLNGMSGSPCLDYRGRFIAIQEGNIEDPTRKPPKFNRAIALHAIRQAITATGNDPLAPVSKRLWKIEDANLRREWATMGLQEIKPSLKGDWESALSRFGPNSPLRKDPFYPVIGRADFQRWIDHARTEEPRIAFVHGGRTAGKSFSAAILREKLRGEEDSVVIVGAEPIGRANTEELLSLMLDPIKFGGRATTSLDGGAVRPAAGVLRYDRMIPTLDEIHVQMSENNLKRVWVLADLGSAEAWSNPGVALFWTQLLEHVRDRGWLRVALAGLDEAAIGQLRSSLGKNSTFIERIAPVTEEELLETAHRMLLAFAPTARTQDEERWLREQWSTATRRLAREYSEHRNRLEAVRVLYEYREHLRTRNSR